MGQLNVEVPIMATMPSNPAVKDLPSGTIFRHGDRTFLVTAGKASGEAEYLVYLDSCGYPFTVPLATSSKASLTDYELISTITVTIEKEE